MVLRIRLARFGKRNNPVYNIVLAQAKSGRNTKPMEVLGTYDPIPKEPIPGITPSSSPSPEGASSSSSSTSPTVRPRKYKAIQLDTARTKYWLGVGAQPSEPVWKLLSMIGLVERQFREDELRRQAREADDRHRAYWAAKAAAGGDGPAAAESPSKASTEEPSS